MISQPRNQTLPIESCTGAAAAAIARESAHILTLSGSVAGRVRKLNNTQDVELMDPECSGNGVITTSFGNAKVGMVDG